MHNLERDSVAKELIRPDKDSAQARELMLAVEKLNLHLEQRQLGKPILCEVVGSQPLEWVIVVPGDDGSYTLQALRHLVEGESIALKRRDHVQIVRGTLHRCHKAVREGDHPNLHLAGLKIALGEF